LPCRVFNDDINFVFVGFASNWFWLFLWVKWLLLN